MAGLFCIRVVEVLEVEVCVRLVLRSDKENPALPSGHSISIPFEYRGTATTFMPLPNSRHVVSPRCSDSRETPWRQQAYVWLSLLLLRWILLRRVVVVLLVQHLSKGVWSIGIDLFDSLLHSGYRLHNLVFLSDGVVVVVVVVNRVVSRS